MKLPPFFSFIPYHYVVNAATLGSVGRVRKAPGTMGSLVGVIWFALLYYTCSPFFLLLYLFFTIFVAIMVCEEFEIRTGKKDPGEVVIDEFVAIPICFLGMNPLLDQPVISLITLIIGFVVFRIFDILKPFGIKKLQDIPGGRGVVVDDLAAALATCITLNILGTIYLKAVAS